MRASVLKCLALVCTCLSLGLLAGPARAQTFRYEPEPRAGEFEPRFADVDPVPRMLPTAPQARPLPAGRNVRAAHDPRDRRRPAPRRPYSRRPVRRFDDHILLSAQGEPIPAGVPMQPFVEDGPPIHPDAPPGEYFDEGVYYGDGPYEGDGPYYDPHLAGEGFLHGPPCGGCGHCQQCDPCGQCYMKRWGGCFRDAASRGVFTENLQLITGKQGFKGPVDQGLNGDFGYHFAFNWGLPLIDRWGIGYQGGGNLILSDFEGRSGPLGHRRVQWFATTGAFHRAAGEYGFQGGAVVDYLYDSFYIRMNLWQIRMQASYVFRHNEIGFWGAVHANSITQTGSFQQDGPLQTFSFEGTDQYTAFYRYQFCNGTYLRTWAGLSGQADGIFGGDATVYVSKKLGLIAAYNYLLPRNQPDQNNNVTESWNLTISFVWYPGYNPCRGSWLNPYRPLFYVADNGWFFVRQK